MPNRLLSKAEPKIRKGAGRDKSDPKFSDRDAAEGFPSCLADKNIGEY